MNTDFKNMAGRCPARSALARRCRSAAGITTFSGAVIPGVSGAADSSNCLTSARPGHFRRHPDLHGLGDEAAYYRCWNQKRRRENIAAGLTWDGRPRVRPIRQDLTQLPRPERKVVTNRERARRFIKQGLTWSGGIRRREFIARGSRLLLSVGNQYKQFRAEIEQKVTEETKSA